MHAILGKPAIFVCVALGIDALILRYDSGVGRIVDAVPLVWLGKSSYSLHLWRQIFLLVMQGDQPYA
jgi:peptidoglycan/LPS O-acetylase OafA/YrhL